jgi:hypothetical protein
MLYIDNCFSPNDCTATLLTGNFDATLAGGRWVKIYGKLVFPSDERLKKNIEPLKSSLDKLIKLKGVSYEWQAEETHGKGRNIGLLAQNVESVLPELVLTDSKGYKSLSYGKIVPVLVEAIKEQQKIIDEQTKKLSDKGQIVDEQQTVLKEVKGEMAKLRAKVNKLKSRAMTAQK